MSLVCNLCKNKNNFQLFARYYQETLDQLQNNSPNDTTKNKFCHLICSCFFTEIEIETMISKETNDQKQLSSDNENLLKEKVVCNGKNLKENVMDGCGVCARQINGYYLIHCLVKYVYFLVLNLKNIPKRM